MAGTLSTNVQDMATDYANFINLDLDSEFKRVYEAVEEMQLRLEEFSSIVGMQQSKNNESIMENIPRFVQLKSFFNQLCRRIDALESFVQTVNYDLTVLESSMDSAEASYGTSERKLAKLNPFSLFKKSSETTTAHQTSPTSYEPPKLFRKEDYFKPES